MNLYTIHIKPMYSPRFSGMKCEVLAYDLETAMDIGKAMFGEVVWMMLDWDNVKVQKGSEV